MVVKIVYGSLGAFVFFLNMSSKSFWGGGCVPRRMPLRSTRERMARASTRCCYAAAMPLVERPRDHANWKEGQIQHQQPLRVYLCRTCWIELVAGTNPWPTKLACCWRVHWHCFWHHWIAPANLELLLQPKIFSAAGVSSLWPTARERRTLLRAFVTTAIRTPVRSKRSAGVFTLFTKHYVIGKLLRKIPG